MKHVVVLRKSNGNFVMERNFYSEDKMDSFLKSMKNRAKIKVPKKYIFRSGSFILFSELIIKDKEGKNNEKEIFCKSNKQ